jgi:hypothetical protein
VVLGLKKWCGSARGRGAAVRDSRLAMCTAMLDGAAERNKEIGKRERQRAKKENEKKQRQRAERENGKRESKLMI